MDDQNNKIFATFIGSFTNFTRKFDCSEKILKMPIEDLRRLEDRDVSSGELAPEALIKESQIAFKSQWGEKPGACEFSYEVLVEDSVRNYFNVNSLHDIRKCKLCNDLVGESNIREHLECHNPNARSMSVNEIDSIFE